MASGHKALNVVVVAEHCLFTIEQQCAVGSIYSHRAALLAPS
jgi:hypothetical protein